METSNSEAPTPSKVTRNVSWDARDWERIEEAAKRWGLEQHMDLGAHDIIKAGTRKYVAEILGSEAPA